MCMKRYVKWLAPLLAVCLLAGCGTPTASSSVPEAEDSTVSDIPQATDTATDALTTDSSAADTTTTAAVEEKSTTTQKRTTTAKPTTASSTTTARQTDTSAPVSTSATTTATTADPNRVTVNGKEYAVGDILSYTVMVKTAQPYGTVKIGLRYVQKGLTVPVNSLPMKQMQYITQNLGIGNFGTGPEDTVGINGFTMTSNKGRAIDTARDGYAGWLLYFETHDRENGVSKNIDCSKGIALFTAKLQITKPGEYIVDCMEYSSAPRGDLTVWGEITA
ncbi:MAG: hypothetical protein IIW40_04990 [Clostridia bacterium]|nr:hypothetical protein [Clostridia bacterium]